MYRVELVELSVMYRVELYYMLELVLKVEIDRGER